MCGIFEFWRNNFFMGMKFDFKFENWEIFGISFQMQTTTETFFFGKKSVSDLAQNLLRLSSEEINLRYFGTFATFFGKLEKNPIPS